MKKELTELQTEMVNEEMDELEYIMFLPPEAAYRELKVLQLLLNQKITSFFFPTNIDISKVKITALWQGLWEILSPNLHTFVWKSTFSQDIRPYVNSLLMVPAIMPNLEVLRLHSFVCNSQHLNNVADHLPKLR
jgi:hypothetical protein